MADNGTPSIPATPTPQDVLEKLNEGAAALQTAQEQLSGDVGQALTRLTEHENNPNAHGGMSGGGASTEQIQTAITDHNADWHAHGLDTPDSVMYQAIKTAASNAVNDLVVGGGIGGDSPIELVPHHATHSTGGTDPITPADIGAVAEGDARLADAREPKTHKHDVSDITGMEAPAEDAPLNTFVTNVSQTTVNAHDGSTEAHSELFKNITAGSSSPIIGICRVETGGGSGLWFNIDADGNPISPNLTYFDNHPVFGGIQRVITDDQIMGKIPQFWQKDFIPTQGMFKGKPCKLISPGQQDGFRIHPAFMNNNAQIPFYLLGCYACTDDGGTPKKLGSKPGKAPFVNVNFDSMKTYCTNRNVNGVSGFMMWDVYQWSALTTLMLIEKATPDMQAAIGQGHVAGSGAVLTDATIQPNWRGFRGLWGNVWAMLDGVRVDSNKRTEIFKNDGTRAWVSTGFSMTPYGSGMTGWIVSMKSGAGNGYNFDDVFLPEVLSGAESGGSYADGFWGPTANGICYQGGDWNAGSACGPFLLHFATTTSNAYTYVGARLAKI